MSPLSRLSRRPLSAAWPCLALALLPSSHAVQRTQVMQVVVLEPVLHSCTLKSADVGEWQLSYQKGPQGKLALRAAQYGHRYPDNTLRVRQSYDQRGQLSDISVQASGFAGAMLNVRAAVTSKGHLLPEQGLRRGGFNTPLSSYLRTPPAQGCNPVGR